MGSGTGLKPGVRKKNLAEGEESQKLYPYPPIPPETIDLVCRALTVANDHGMTEESVVHQFHFSELPRHPSPCPLPQEARVFNVFFTLSLEGRGPG